MLKALLERTLDLANIKFEKIGGNVFTKDRLIRVKDSNQHSPETLELNNLTGLVDYVKQLPTAGGVGNDVFFAVTSPTKVSLMSQIDPDNDNTQFTFATAVLSVDNFNFNHWFDLETFIISLLSQFEETEERDATIETLAHLSNEHIVNNTDDKFSQKLQVKTGLTTKAEVEVKNPINLKPFRTFREIDQPESNFILRYRNQNGIQAALFEGDGGAWKLKAIQNIKNWLTEKTSIPVIG